MNLSEFQQSLATPLRPSPMRLSPHRTIIHFPGQYYDEEVILLCRRVVLPFLFTLFLVVLLLPSPFIIWFLAWWLFNINILLADANIIIFIMVSAIYYLLLAMSTFLNWIDYYLDVTIITDRRIVDIDQTGLVNRDISETNLIDIKESYVEQKGLLQNLFNYGTVFVQIPATRQSIEIQNVANPREVARIINDLHNQIIQKQRLRVVDAATVEQQEETPPNGYLQNQP